MRIQTPMTTPLQFNGDLPLAQFRMFRTTQATDKPST